MRRIVFLLAFLLSACAQQPQQQCELDYSQPRIVSINVGYGMVVHRTVYPCR